MKRLLDDYIFSDDVRYEGHELRYRSGEEDFCLTGILAAATLSALLVDTPEGDARGIVLETPQEREAWFERYEREVRREDGGLFDNELQSLSEAYLSLHEDPDLFANIGSNERLTDLAFQLTFEYMHRLVRELVCEQIYDVCKWHAPFAQWLYDAGFVETRRQRLLDVDWEELEEVVAFAQDLDIPEEKTPTFVFRGLSAEQLLNAYFDWRWQDAQKEAALFPDANVRLAEAKQRILEEETDDDFIWSELKELPQADINLYKKWMKEWKAFIEEKMAPAPISKKKVHDQQQIFRDNITPIPPENSYAATREYIHERCKYDNDFENFFKNMHLTTFCRQLTFIFGWSVDPNSLRKRLNPPKRYYRRKLLK